MSISSTKNWFDLLLLLSSKIKKMTEQTAIAMAKLNTGTPVVVAMGLAIFAPFHYWHQRTLISI